MRPSKALAPLSAAGPAASSAARKSGRRASILRADATIVDKARAPAPTALRSSAAPACSSSRLVGEYEPPIAANAPGVSQAGVDPAFAHREAPEHQRLGDKKFGLARGLDLETPLEPRAVEDQRLLRQPEEARARREGETGRDVRSGAVAAIDPFRRCRRRLDFGPFA